MSIELRHVRESYESYLPKKVVRGPFVWELVTIDGMSALRTVAYDGMKVAYRGTLGTRLTAECDLDGDPSDLASAVEQVADESLVYFKSIHQLFEDFNE